MSCGHVRSVSASRPYVVASREDETPVSTFGHFVITYDGKNSQALVVPIKEFITLVGREPACDIRINDCRVSKQHSKIVATRNSNGETELRVFCITERNNVIVDGESVTLEGKILRDGSVVRVFDAALRWHSRGNEITSSRTNRPYVLASREDGTPASSFGHFEVEYDSIDSQALVVPIKEFITLVGRGPACDIRINDCRVSRQHSKIVAARNSNGETELRIFCITERSRVVVDGERVKLDGKIIRNGSVVRIFEAAMRWHSRGNEITSSSSSPQAQGIGSHNDKDVFKTPGLIGTPSRNFQRMGSSYGESLSAADTEVTDSLDVPAYVTITSPKKTPGADDVETPKKRKTAPASKEEPNVIN